MWFVGVGLTISVLLLGCAGLEMDEPAQVSALSGTLSDDEGEKNLAAIRALVSTERQGSSPAFESSDQPKREPDVYWVPPDWLSSYFSSRPSSGQESDRSPEYVAPSSSSSSTSSLSRRRKPSADITVRSPRVPKPSSHDPEAESWSHVPPYIFSAPAGPVYPGTMRCVPDTLGGQRCHAE
jgi:hypothetical protein